MQLRSSKYNLMNTENVSWWLKLIIAVLSALVGAIGGGAAVACGMVVV